MKVLLKTQADYNAAVDRIQELTGATEGSPEERLLIDLILAVEIWRSKHRL